MDISYGKVVTGAIRRPNITDNSRKHLCKTWCICVRRVCPICVDKNQARVATRSMDSKPSNPPEAKLSRFEVFDDIPQMPLGALGTAAIWDWSDLFSHLPRGAAGWKSWKFGASRSNLALSLKKRMVWMRKISLFSLLSRGASSYFRLLRHFLWKGFGNEINPYVGENTGSLTVTLSCVCFKRPWWPQASRLYQLNRVLFKTNFTFNLFFGIILRLNLGISARSKIWGCVVLITLFAIFTIWICCFLWICHHFESSNKFSQNSNKNIVLIWNKLGFAFALLQIPCQ